MKNIHFIVNPIAGKGRLLITETFLSQKLAGTNFSHTLKYTDYKGHARVLAKESLKSKPSAIVACGGDGTINEVASCLVNTNVPLGIVPVGSGNGLASSLHLPRSVDQAIDIIIKGDIEKIDVGKVNGEYFFSNMGIGFDAKVIEVFEGTSKRQLIAYVKAILTSVFTYRYNNRLTIKMQGEEIGVNPFLFFVSNSNVMGYNFSLTKNASLIDGYLDVLIIKKINKLKVLLFGIFTMFGLSLSAEEVKYYKTKKLSLISHKSPGQSVLYQKDGELCRFDQNEISLSVSEKALHVIIKQDYRE